MLDRECKPIYVSVSKRTIAVLLTAVLFTMALLHAGTAIADKGDFSLYVDKSGNIRLPDDFRLSMTHLGSWFVPEGEASGFHDVYTEPETARAYRKTGKFPDGATLVKELRSSAAGTYTRATMSAMQQVTSSNGL